MSRRPAFGFNAFDMHIQPSMRRAFPLADMSSAPFELAPFELSLRERLEALKRIFDCEMQTGRAATVM